MNGYSDDKADFEEIEASELYAYEEDLRLISGKLFLMSGQHLILLKSVTYKDQGLVIVTPKALWLVCPECGKLYYSGFKHDCNGVSR